MTDIKTITEQAILADPKAPTRAIARYLAATYPQLFESFEKARDRVRYMRRERYSHKGQFAAEPVGERTAEEKKEAQAWARIPESLNESWEDFKLPTGIKKALILADIHFPFHDVAAIEAALDYGDRHDVDAIILNGDILDCYQLSRYSRDPHRYDLQAELDMLTEFLRFLKQEFECAIYFKNGNHEERFVNYLRAKAPELLGVREFRLDVLCKFGELGVIQVPDRRIIRAGKLSILHGHEFGESTFSPVNPARGYYLRSKRSMIAGHYHATSEHSEKDLHGEVVTTWSMGCLCGLRPDYRPYNRWNHGASLVSLFEEGQYEVDNFRIIDGRVR